MSNAGQLGNLNFALLNEPLAKACKDNTAEAGEKLRPGRSKLAFNQGHKLEK